MVNILKIKNSNTPGNVPASLVDGEIAINQGDEKLFYKNSGGAVKNLVLPKLVRVDVVQNFSETEKLRGRKNIDVELTLAGITTFTQFWALCDLADARGVLIDGLGLEYAWPQELPVLRSKPIPLKNAIITATGTTTGYPIAVIAATKTNQPNITAVLGEHVLNFGSAPTCNINDFICVNSNVVRNADRPAVYLQGDFATVVAVNGNNVEISRPLRFAHTNQPCASYVYTIPNRFLLGQNVLWKTTTQDYAFTIEGIQGDIEFHGQGWLTTGIYALNCGNVTLFARSASPNNPATNNYGLFIAGHTCARVYADANAGRHAVTGGWNYAPEVYIMSGNFEGGQSNNQVSVDAHGGCEIFCAYGGTFTSVYSAALKTYFGPEVEIITPSDCAVPALQGLIESPTGATFEFYGSIVHNGTADTVIKLKRELKNQNDGITDLPDHKFGRVVIAPRKFVNNNPNAYPIKIAASISELVLGSVWQSVPALASPILGSQIDVIEFRPDFKSVGAFFNINDTIDAMPAANNPIKSGAPILRGTPKAEHVIGGVNTVFIDVTGSATYKPRIEFDLSAMDVSGPALRATNTRGPNLKLDLVGCGNNGSSSQGRSGIYIDAPSTSPVISGRVVPFGDVLPDYQNNVYYEAGTVVMNGATPVRRITSGQDTAFTAGNWTNLTNNEIGVNFAGLTPDIYRASTNYLAGTIVIWNGLPRQRNADGGSAEATFTPASWTTIAWSAVTHNWPDLLNVDAAGPGWKSIAINGLNLTDPTEIIGPTPGRRFNIRYRNSGSALKTWFTFQYLTDRIAMTGTVDGTNKTFSIPFGEITDVFLDRMLLLSNEYTLDAARQTATLTTAPAVNAEGSQTVAAGRKFG